MAGFAPWIRHCTPLQRKKSGWIKSVRNLDEFVCVCSCSCVCLFVQLCVFVRAVVCVIVCVCASLCLSVFVLEMYEISEEQIIL